MVTTWPLQGNYIESESSLRIAIPDYPFHFGQQNGISTGIINNDPLNWSIQTYLIDNIPQLYKSDAISQFNTNGIDILVTIERSETLTNVSEFIRGELSLLPGTYRKWIVSIEIAGYSTVANEIIVPDDCGRYLTNNEMLSFLSEYLNQPGEFTVQYWDFFYKRESDPLWRHITDFVSNSRYDGNGTDFGIRVVNVDGQNRIEFSNRLGNTYILGGEHFSY